MIWRTYRYNHVRIVRGRWVAGWVEWRPLVWVTGRYDIPLLWRVPLVIVCPVIWRLK